VATIAFTESVSMFFVAGDLKTNLYTQSAVGHFSSERTETFMFVSLVISDYAKPPIVFFALNSIV